MTYVTRSDLMKQLDIGVGDPSRVDNAVIDWCIKSAEKTIANRTGRSFGADPALVDGEDTADAVEKTFRIRYQQVRVRIPDLRVAESVVLDGTELVADIDYQLDMFDGGEPATNLYLTSLYPGRSPLLLQVGSTVAITGRWGFDPVPDDVYEIALQIAARKYRKREAMFADQAEVGQGTYDYRAGLTKEQTETLDAYRPVRASMV